MFFRISWFRGIAVLSEFTDDERKEKGIKAGVDFEAGLASFDAWKREWATETLVIEALEDAQSYLLTYESFDHIYERYGLDKLLEGEPLPRSLEAAKGFQ